MNEIKPSASSAFSPVLQSNNHEQREHEESNQEVEELVNDLKDVEVSASSSVDSEPATIGMLERLIRTHPIWFQPEIGRAAVVHLLQGKDLGSFIVRQSSKPSTMALSVRLPDGRGPHIEHYLIETVENGKLHLEGSENFFTAVPTLIYHYCLCCDELPVQLNLPQVLTEASRQRLTAFALLGQDFWQSSLSRLPYTEDYSISFLNKKTSKNTTHSNSNEIKAPTPPPPPVPPKTNVDDFLVPLLKTSEYPLIDTKKSSTVPVAIVTGQVHNAPKPPPRTIIPHVTGPPPIPPRTFKPPPRSTQIAPASNILVTTTVSVNLTTNSIVPSTEVTLIDISPKDIESQPNSHRNSITSNGITSSSQIAENYSQLSYSPKSLDSSSACSQGEDELVPCYRSKVEDKFSDYEDIWSHNGTGLAPMPIIVKEEKPKLLIKPGFRKSKSKSMSTQTDEINPVERKLSSPFYMDPVDAILSKTKMKDSHYGSDPNLTISSHKSVNQNLSQSLESLLNNMRNSGNDYCCQVLNPKNPKQGEVMIQVGDGRIKDYRSESPSPSMLSTTTSNTKNDSDRGGRESSWPVDSSWEWQSSDGEEDDLPNICKIRSKQKPLSNKKNKKDMRNEKKEESDLDKYRRFSYKYIIESAVEESDVEEKDKKDDQKTVEDLISPALKVPKLELMKSIASEAESLGCYDNLVQLRLKTEGNRQSLHFPSKEDIEKKNSGGTHTDTETVFSEPWDSNFWEGLLHKVFPKGDNSSVMGLTPEDEGIENGQAFGLNHLKPPEMVKRNSKHSSLSDPNELDSSGASSSIADPNSRMTSTYDITEVTSLNSDALSRFSMQDHTRASVTESETSNVSEETEDEISKKKREDPAGKSICNYILTLAEEGDNTFAKSVTHFIECTKEAQGGSPQTIMRNIRQFMSGMKNYLVKHGEKDLLDLVKEERKKLKSSEFLNIDAIIEGTLHKLVIKPLKTFLYERFVDEYTKNNSLEILSKNIKLAQSMSPDELGIRSDISLPDATALSLVQKFLTKLQKSYSPLKKLEYLLAAISIIYNNVKRIEPDQPNHQSLSTSTSHSNLKPEHLTFGADDFLPIFIYVLVHCGMISAEIEADYMWGLLQPSLLSGEGGYYLTTLSSCVHVLKSLNKADDKSTPENSINSSPSSNLEVSSQTSKTHLNGESIGSLRSTASNAPSTPSSSRLPCVADLQGYMKFILCDELSSSIITKTLPVRPSMSTRDVCKMIAHKFKITNPEDFGLFRLREDGNEMELGDNEEPQMIKADALAGGKEIYFAYKRIDAKFVWPPNLK